MSERPIIAFIREVLTEEIEKEGGSLPIAANEKTVGVKDYEHSENKKL